MDMSPTIIPKSDQINADDMLSGPRTITITRVSGNEGNAEQPVNVFFEGDNGKPFRPCKSMRRVMVSVWGADAKDYAGRSMTLYRDPEVMWGGMKVGGIRISHMSHIDREKTLVLTASKTNRKPCVIKPLKVEAKKADAEPKTKPAADEEAIVDLEWPSTGDIESIGVSHAITKLRKAHGSAKVDSAAWAGIWDKNSGWLEQHAPDVARELSVRGQG